MPSVMLAALAAVALVSAPMSFVDASGNVVHGPWAVDGDHESSWVGFARREDAWIVLKLRTPGRLSGVVVHMTRMPANTFLHVDVSNDGRGFSRVLRDLRVESDEPVTFRFESPRDAAYLRLSFENASRQPVIGFALREIQALREVSAAATADLPVVALPAPPRLFGAVWGRYEGQRVLLVVGDRVGEAQEIRADGHLLKILASVPTQALCAYPYPRVPRLSLWAQVGGKATSRTVTPVSRPIAWPPPVSPPRNEQP